TCHRVEVYGFGPGPARSELRRLEGEAAVRHLFRVASGLESAAVGESEVLGQVRDSLVHARQSGTDERVARLVEAAIAVGRTARRLPPLADLSAPPAVPAGVRAVLGPDFLGIDELWGERRPAEAAWVARAEAAVEDGVCEYMGWVRGRGSVGTLVALRERGE